MGLANALCVGQDVKVDLDNTNEFRELRVYYPSLGRRTIFVDRNDYLKKRERKKNPNIKAISIDSVEYYLDFEGRIRPYEKTPPKCKEEIFTKDYFVYEEIQEIL